MECNKQKENYFILMETTIKDKHLIKIDKVVVF
jgi:hypothetical protein